MKDGICVYVAHSRMYLCFSFLPKGKTPATQWRWLRMKHFQKEIMQIMRLFCWKIPGFYNLSLHWVPYVLIEYIGCPKHLLPGLVI